MKYKEREMVYGIRKYKEREMVFLMHVQATFYEQSIFPGFFT